jgi:hypothetical protein
MNRTAETPDHILVKAKILGADFGKKVAEFYNPFRCPEPSKSASYGLKRNEGGQREELQKRQRDRASIPCNKIETDTGQRIEPYVIFICGPAGSGKSTLTTLLYKKYCECRGIDVSRNLYSRNCHTPHWDGYDDQRVTILDDFGQNREECTDLSEFMCLVSNNRYVLPMAELSQKGKTFASELIIVNSNLRLDGSLDRIFDKKIYSQDAFVRRLHTCIQVLDTDFVSGKVRFRDLTSHLLERMTDKKRLLGDNSLLDKPFNLREYHSQSRVALINSIVGVAISEVQKRYTRVGLELGWNQSVYSGDFTLDTDSGLTDFSFHHNRKCKSFSFPLDPPDVHPVCRTCCVPKALGARMITVGEAENRCLKPLQIAMWEALGAYDCFKATHGADLESCFSPMGSPKDDEKLLSGDYKSATDYLNSDLSNAMLDGILSQIDHEPTRRWARWENSPHLIEYPDWTGLDPVLQKNGQLMGSLLSFPLLCLINKLVCELSGFRKYMINGDDLLAFATDEQLENWKQIGGLCGLKPSIGKSYFLRNFGTFNSQLITRDGVLKKHLNLNVLMRKDKPMGRCFHDFLTNGGARRILVEHNEERLKHDARNLDIPVEFGGLGDSFRYDRGNRSSTFSRRDRLCYLYQLRRAQLRQIKPISGILPPGFVWIALPRTKENLLRYDTKIPVSRSKIFPFRVDVNNSTVDRNACIKEFEQSEIYPDIHRCLREEERQRLKKKYNPREEQVSKSDLVRFEKRTKLTNSRPLRDFLNGKSIRLEDCPPLNTVVFDYKICHSKNVDRFECNGISRLLDVLEHGISNSVNNGLREARKPGRAAYLSSIRKLRLKGHPDFVGETYDVDKDFELDRSLLQEIMKTPVPTVSKTEPVWTSSGVYEQTWKKDSSGSKRLLGERWIDTESFNDGTLGVDPHFL